MTTVSTSGRPLPPFAPGSATQKGRVGEGATRSLGKAGQWPALPLQDWNDTRATLHMWTQVVGKIRLALTPLINHWWNVPLYVNARGLTTSPIPYRDRPFELWFDFLDQELVLQMSNGLRTPRCSPGLEGHRRETAKGSWAVVQWARSGKTQVTRQDRASCVLDISHEVTYVLAHGRAYCKRAEGPSVSWREPLRIDKLSSAEL